MEKLLLEKYLQPMSFYIFGIEVRYYGVMIAIGILSGFLLGCWLAKKKGYSEDVPYVLVLTVVPSAILGARLYFLISEGRPIIEWWSRFEGLGIYGGIMGGVLAVYIYARAKKVSFFAVADLLVPCLIMGQILGRWGNFFNGEAHGVMVDFDFFPISTYINNGIEPAGFYLATFFYESFLNALGFILLLRIYFRQKKAGTTLATYLIWYGCVRALIEPFRTDSMKLIGESEFLLNKINFLISIAIAGIGVLILWLNNKGKISQDDKGLFEGVRP
ncbi:MAG: prolipoprotein diacylglyceryl transferase [Christensenellaceae bacterium]|jgi:phosphatidylglycerol:prolipoprotein diacylglycerol transferase|nr:prolipoprotein diacylglyceryl transferase [Christensenellaceae bacterium]